MRRGAAGNNKARCQIPEIPFTHIHEAAKFHKSGETRPFDFGSDTKTKALNEDFQQKLHYFFKCHQLLLNYADRIQSRELPLDSRGTDLQPRGFEVRQGPASRVIKRELPGLSKVNHLKGAAIYGANASGKSNVIEAIRFLANFVKTSATRIELGDKTGAAPFKLDQVSGSKPSEFEITFEANGVRYLFGLSVTPKHVVEEFLIAYPKGSPQRWYHRVLDQESGVYEWAKASTAFKHDKALQKTDA